MNLDKFFELLRGQEFADALRWLQSITNAGSLGKTWKSDAEKVELFVRDCFAYVAGGAAKAIDLLKQGDPVGAEVALAALVPFAAEAEVVLRAYVNKATSLKPQFPRDLWSGRFRDPFKNERKMAALFRAKWF